MTMVRLSPRQRTALGETLRELANLAAAALGLGQFVSDRPLSWSVLFSVAAVWLILLTVGVALLSGDEDG